MATNTRLHLIEPLGFKLSEKHLVRAGLDYWDKLDVTVYSDFADFLKRNPGAKLYMAQNGGHVQHWEQLEKYNQVTLDFLLAQLH